MRLSTAPILVIITKPKNSFRVSDIAAEYVPARLLPLISLSISLIKGKSWCGIRLFADTPIPINTMFKMSTTGGVSGV